MATELYRTRKVQLLAQALRDQCTALGAELPPGDAAQRLVADRAQDVARQLGVTPRTVLDRYMTEESMMKLAASLAQQMAELGDVLAAAPGIEVSIGDGIMVLVAFGMCSTVAQRNLDSPNAMIVMRDAADSTVHVGVELATAAQEPVIISGMTLAIGRKVITAVLDHLRTGEWQCTCQTRHRPDGGCPLQDRFAVDLATLGGWAPNADAR